MSAVRNFQFSRAEVYEKMSEKYVEYYESPGRAYRSKIAYADSSSFGMCIEREKKKFKFARRGKY